MPFRFRVMNQIPGITGYGINVIPVGEKLHKASELGMPESIPESVRNFLERVVRAQNIKKITVINRQFYKGFADIIIARITIINGEAFPKPFRNSKGLEQRGILKQEGMRTLMFQLVRKFPVVRLNSFFKSLFLKSLFPLNIPGLAFI